MAEKTDALKMGKIEKLNHDFGLSLNASELSKKFDCFATGYDKAEYKKLYSETLSQVYSDLVKNGDEMSRLAEEPQEAFQEERFNNARFGLREFDFMMASLLMDSVRTDTLDAKDVIFGGLSRKEFRNAIRKDIKEETMLDSYLSGKPSKEKMISDAGKYLDKLELLSTKDSGYIAYDKTEVFTELNEKLSTVYVAISSEKNNRNNHDILKNLKERYRKITGTDIDKNIGYSENDSYLMRQSEANITEFDSKDSYNLRMDELSDIRGCERYMENARNFGMDALSYLNSNKTRVNADFMDLESSNEKEVNNDFDMKSEKEVTKEISNNL